MCAIPFNLSPFPLLRMTRAAMRLQAFWRGFKAREAVGTKRKGGKKKGKKK